MTTVKANIPATVAIKVQGHETEIDVSKLPQESLEIMVAYGIRRKYQDSINSIAKELRDNGDDVNGEELFHDFHEKVLAGELNMRGESVVADPLDKYRKQVVREIISRDKSGAAYKAYAAIDSDDRKARDQYLLDLAEKNAEAVDKLAAARKQADDAAKGADIEF